MSDDGEGVWWAESADARVYHQRFSGALVRTQRELPFVPVSVVAIPGGLVAVAGCPAEGSSCVVVYDCLESFRHSLSHPCNSVAFVGHTLYELGNSTLYTHV